MIEIGWIVCGAAIAILMAWLLDRCVKSFVEERIARKGKLGEGDCWYTSKVSHIGMKRKIVKLSY